MSQQMNTCRNFMSFERLSSLRWHFLWWFDFLLHTSIGFTSILLQVPFLLQTWSLYGIQLKKNRGSCSIPLLKSILGLVLTQL
jgi:hypothetical protein